MFRLGNSGGDPCVPGGSKSLVSELGVGACEPRALLCIAVGGRDDFCVDTDWLRGTLVVVKPPGSYNKCQPSMLHNDG